jgi:hypothetical protein
MSDAEHIRRLIVERIADMQMLITAKSATRFLNFKALPAELRLKIWGEAAETARNDKLHAAYWRGYGSHRNDGGRPSDIAANFEALECSKVPHAIPVNPFQYCICQSIFGKHGHRGVFLGTAEAGLYATPQVLALHWTSWGGAVSIVYNREPAITIKQMTAGLRHERRKLKRIAMELCTEQLSDCLRKDDNFMVSMDAQLARAYELPPDNVDALIALWDDSADSNSSSTRELAVEEAAQHKLTDEEMISSSELVEIQLAGGNLHGIETIADVLVELIIVIKPDDFSMGWTADLALKHILLRLDLLRISHPDFKNPKIRVAESVSEIDDRGLEIMYPAVAMPEAQVVQ